TDDGQPFPVPDGQGHSVDRGHPAEGPADPVEPELDSGVLPGGVHRRGGPTGTLVVAHCPVCSRSYGGCWRYSSGSNVQHWLTSSEVSTGTFQYSPSLLRSTTRM